MGHVLGRVVAFAVIGAVCAAPATVFAGKIAFVNVERAVETVDEGKAMLKELEDWSSPREERLEEMRTQLQQLQQRIVQQRPVASAEALERLQREEIDARRRLEDLARDSQREFETKQNELLRDVARKLNTVVGDYAKANDYDAVFIFKTSTLIYLADSADLTDTVIRLYNERFPHQAE